MPKEPLNVVVLGGSYAGLAVAHNFLDHLKHRLCTFEGAPCYRVVLISPSTHLFWNICAPSALASPSLVQPEDAFVPIKPAFSQYSVDEFTFFQGRATGVDTSTQRITFEVARNKKREKAGEFTKDNTNVAHDADFTTSTGVGSTRIRPASTDGKSEMRTVQYHALVVATGSSAHSPLFSLHGAHEKTLEEIKVFQRKLELAHSVLIVGGGPSGVETAGELALHYNRWRQSRKSKVEQDQLSSVIEGVTISRDTSVQKMKPIKERQSAYSESMSDRQREGNKRDSGVGGVSSRTHASEDGDPNLNRRIPKQITLLSGSHRLLSSEKLAISQKAERKIRRLGIRVVHNLREVVHKSNPDGSRNCLLSNGSSIKFDVLISATGMHPNTQFLPSCMLDRNGYVITDSQTLRVYGQSIGERVYAIGDCASYSKKNLQDVYGAVPYLMENMLNDLLTHEYKLQTVTSVLVPGPSMNTFLNGANVWKFLKRKKLQDNEDKSFSEPSKQVSQSEIDASLEKTLQQGQTSSSSRGHLPASCCIRFQLRETDPLSHHRKPLLTEIEARQKITNLKDAIFEPSSSDTLSVPIPRFGGTNLLSNWGLSSCLAHLIKGKKYQMGRMRQVVEKGRWGWGFHVGRRLERSGTRFCGG